MLGFHHGNFTIAALQFIYCPQNNFHVFCSSHSKPGKKEVLITIEWKLQTLKDTQEGADLQEYGRWY